MAQLFSSLI